MGAAPEAVERWQRFVAEQVATDERWRGDLEDAAATPLLDWALALTERAVARLGAAGALDEDAAYDVAGAARAVLGAAAAPSGATPGRTSRRRSCRPSGRRCSNSAADGAASLASVLGGAASAKAARAAPAEPPATGATGEPPPQTAAPKAAIWTTIPAPPPDRSGAPREKPT